VIQPESPHIIFLAAVAVIALGYTLRKTGLVRREDGHILARIVINVTLPAVILKTVPGIVFRPSLLFLPLLALLHTGLAFVAASVLFRKRPVEERGLMTLCSMGFNNGLFAFPIVMAVWGVEAVRMMAVFDVGNGFVVLGINYVVAGWFGSLIRSGHQGNGGLTPIDALKRTGHALVTSVPMIVFAVAVIMNLAGIVLPASIDRAVGTVADANGALALLVLGIFQSLKIERRDVPIALRVLALRYLLGAVMAVAAVIFLGSTPLYRQILAIVFILPIGMTVIPYSLEAGLNTRLATTLVNLSIFISFFIMWGVVAVTAV
jgi:malate permease and related proteins